MTRPCRLTASILAVAVAVAVASGHGLWVVDDAVAVRERRDDPGRRDW